ncbi:hypothetical protein [Arthrobacter sp. TMN-50]
MKIMPNVQPDIRLFFSEHFEVDVERLEDYGALDINVISDLPVFIDPFLLFHSNKADYQSLHEGILRYLGYLRERASEELDLGTIKELFMFQEVKENWLGVCLGGNRGSGLGIKFARGLKASLNDIFQDFGDEKVTRSSHLEKVCLLQEGVGKDNISDFTTNLIKEFLLEYTQTFARAQLDPKHCKVFNVPRARFNYETEVWQHLKFYLPARGSEFFILTPIDILTKEDTWISNHDLISGFDRLPDAIPDDQQRARVNSYFTKQLGLKPKREDVSRAVQRTIRTFPELIDHYIRLKEDEGDQAERLSTERVREMKQLLIDSVKEVSKELATTSDFNDLPWNSFQETRARILAFKRFIEDQEGYQLLNKEGRVAGTEKDAQLIFYCLWHGSAFDVNREPNNGRGPVDYAVSKGSGDKTLVEMKLGKNSQLKRNLEHQVPIYEAANNTNKSFKLILCYTAEEIVRVQTVLRELNLHESPNVFVIDARNDNKPSASKATSH